MVPIPGPSAAAAALSASGLPTHRFLFLGFPPPKKVGLVKMLESAAGETGTLIFYLPARKIADFLENVRDTLGDRRVVIARELTKVYEEFIRGTASEILSSGRADKFKGEVTLLVEGRTRDSR